MRLFVLHKTGLGCRRHEICDKNKIPNLPEIWNSFSSGERKRNFSKTSPTEESLELGTVNLDVNFMCFVFTSVCDIRSVRDATVSSLHS